MQVDPMRMGQTLFQFIFSVAGIVRLTLRAPFRGLRYLSETLHLGNLHHGRVVKVLKQHVCSVESPEKFAVNGKCGNPVNARCYGSCGIMTQRIFHFVGRDKSVYILNFHP